MIEDYKIDRYMDRKGDRERSRRRGYRDRERSGFPNFIFVFILYKCFAFFSYYLVHFKIMRYLKYLIILYYLHSAVISKRGARDGR